MRTWYFILRIGGYALGLAGVLCFTLGRQGYGSWTTLQAVGGLSMILGFMSFLAAYFMYVADRLKRRTRPEDTIPKGGS